MSFEAIYEVTRALRRLLLTHLRPGNPTAVVTLLPPGDALPNGLGVNLYLYRVMESPFTRNRPWPGDRQTPASDQPALGLQLSYLLTPLGTRPDPDADAGDDAHTMLGLAMRTLHENPVLNDIHLPSFDADALLPDFLLNSYEQIKMMLLPTSIEELSKIWATINQPYRLSVAYELSLVEIVPTPPPPVGGGIVLTTGVNVITLDPPRLTQLSPTIGALARIVASNLTANTLQIDGFGLSFPGQTPTVKVGGKRVVINATPAATDTSMTVTLPTDLDAGPQVDVSVTLNRRTSRPLVLTVIPWLTNLTPIRTALDPAQPSDLKLALNGNGFTATPASVRFEGPGAPTIVNVFDPGGTDSSASIDTPTALINGVYNVRLVLGDVSASATNSRTFEVIPRVDSPIVLSTTVVGPKTVHRLTINGARLAGSDIRLVLDGVTFQQNANATNTQLVVTLGRLLNAGTHRVALRIDGHTSRTVDLVV